MMLGLTCASSDLPSNDHLAECLVGNVCSGHSSAAVLFIDGVVSQELSQEIVSIRSTVHLPSCSVVVEALHDGDVLGVRRDQGGQLRSYQLSQILKFFTRNLGDQLRSEGHVDHLSVYIIVPEDGLV